MRFLRMLVIAILFPMTASANVYVDDDSACVTECGTIDQPYKTIQEAIDAAADGETLEVLEGLYREHVTIDRPLTLRANGEALIETPDYNVSAVTITAGDVTLDGFSITGATRSNYPLTAGVEVPYGLHGAVSILNNEIFGNYQGIKLEYNWGDVTVYGNTIRDNIQGGLYSSIFYGTITAYENDIVGNNYPFILDVRTAPALSRIYHNNIIGNANTNLMAEAVQWHEGYTGGGNYWDDWNGPDANGDYIVDQPKGFDYFPVTVANGWELLSDAVLEHAVHNATSGVNYSTISDAVAAAVQGDVIEVDGGTITGLGHYYESVDIDLPLTLKGSDGAMIHSAHSKWSAVTITSGDVSVEGFSITGGTYSQYPQTAGVEIPYGIHGAVRISNNDISGNYQGIKLEYNWADVTVSGNIIHDNAMAGLYSSIFYGTITAYENDILGNAYPFILDVRTDPGLSRIYHNNIIGNTNTNLMAETVQWHDGYAGGGNYWDDWAGPDTNGDYIVDRPKGFDYFPVIVANGWELLSDAVLEHAVHNVTSGEDFSTISDAFAAAVQGDVIEVEGGTITGLGHYYESVDIDLPLTLKGSDGAMIHSAHSKWSAVTITSGDVSVEGFSITGGTYSRYPQAAGVEIPYGIHGTVRISNNELWNNWHGIKLYYNWAEVVISGNTIRDNRGAALNSGIFYGTINATENKILNNDYAFLLDIRSMPGLSVVYHNNIIGNANIGTLPNEPLWHDGYPSGGNHWSFWTTPDLAKGLNQDIPGADGIVDTAYSYDLYPFVEPNGWVPKNIAPVANAGADQIGLPEAPYVGTTFELDATGSYDPDGVIVEYLWFFDDGTVHVDTAGGSTDGIFDGKTTFIYSDASVPHTVVLTVTDDYGWQDSDDMIVQAVSYEDGIDYIEQFILDANLDSGPQNALLGPLHGASNSLEDGDVAAALEALEGLMDHLNQEDWCSKHTEEGFCESLLALVEDLYNAL